MKRLPLWPIALTLAILAGFLFLFPLKWVLLLFALLGLIAAQVVVVRRHLRVAGNQQVRPGKNTTLRKVAREALAPEMGPSRPAPAKTTGKAPPKEELPFDSALFSRFRSQLERAEQAVADQPAVNEPPAPPREEGRKARANPDKGGVRVRLSQAARQAMAPTTAPAKRRSGTPRQGQQTGEEEQDLFADLRTTPLLRQANSSEDNAPLRASRRKAPTKDGSVGVAREVSAERSGGARPASQTPREPAPRPSAREQDMLLTMVEEAQQKGDQAGASAGLEQVLRLQRESGGLPPARLGLAQVRVAIMKGEHEQARAHFEGVVSTHPPSPEEDYLSRIEQLTGGVPGEAGARLRVSMLLKVLAVLREADDRSAMDRIYDRIEQAQEQSGDEQGLIQHYKNHLELKTSLEDVEGQLNLIDQIGNRYYKLGDTDAARKFYEQGLRLREARQAAAEEIPPSP